MQNPTLEPELRGLGTSSDVDAVVLDRTGNKAVIGFHRANIRLTSQIYCFVKQLDMFSNIIRDGTDSRKRLQGFKLGVALMAETLAPKLPRSAVDRQCHKHGLAMFRRSGIAISLTKPGVVAGRGFMNFQKVQAFLP